MKFNKRKPLKILAILLIFLINITLITNLTNNYAQFDIEPTKKNEVQTDKSLAQSNVIYHDQKYNVYNWWNESYNYRVGIELEELNSAERYQPIDVLLTFQENEHHENTTRLVSYNATGNDEWSEPLPLQVWNVNKYNSTNFIQSCKITFLANVSANTNRSYFLYYNNNMENINLLHYNTNFSSILSQGRLNVSIGTREFQYQVEIEEGFGVSSLRRNNTNFHLKNSLIPQRQLVHPSLNLLVHCEEGSGSTIIDSSGSDLEGNLEGDTTWESGKVNNGLLFDGDGDFITFENALNSPFGSTSKAFTVSAWIKPNALTSSQSTHGIMNCFMAKASEPYNDNFEMGIYKVNDTQGLLQLYINTQDFENSSIFGNETIDPIVVDQWNFIAVKYFEGNVDVRINDKWYARDIYNSEPWEGSSYLNQASGSHFTIGTTLNNNTYFNGTMDEIAVYNTSLSTNDIELNKLAYRNSFVESIVEIENGEVFSRYQVDWTDICQMHIQDIITFYFDYNLWNINRSIYLDSSFDASKANFNALNTFYNFSEVGNHQECKYIYDGIVKNDITSTGFIGENYTIIHNALNTKDTLGIFIANYSVSDDNKTSINEFKGNISYSNKIIEYTPGSINDFDNDVGGEEYKLHVSFWEFFNSVNQSGDMDDMAIAQFFDDILISLRNSLRVHVFSQDRRFYYLELCVKDIDQNPVDRARVSLYNLTEEGKIDTCVRNQYTGSNGRVSLLYLRNSTYTLNISYDKYNRSAFQIIPNVINITINEALADSSGWIHYNVSNVRLTSLKMTLQIINKETNEIEKRAINANVTFWINDGSGNEYIGSEMTDDNGMAEFCWLNFSGPLEGNLTFAVFWHGELQDITAENDIGGNLKNATVYFYKEESIIVNISSFSEFSTALVEYFPDIVCINDEITFKVNYTYTVNYTNPLPITNAKVLYSIKCDNENISSILLEFTETSIDGTYETKINTSSSEDPEIIFSAGNTYYLFVQASKAGYIPATTVISFEILGRRFNPILGDNFIGNTTIYYSGNPLDLEILLKDYYDDSILNDAEINMTIEEIMYNFNETGNGIYTLCLDTFRSLNIYDGDQMINASVILTKENYETSVIQITIIVTLKSFSLILNATNLVNYQITVEKGTNIKFELELRDPTNASAPLSDASVYIRINNKYYAFNRIGNGLYTYTFSTNKYETLLSSKILPGTIYISKSNFKSKTIGIVITIKMDEIYPGIPTFYLINIIEVFSALLVIMIGALIIRRKNRIDISKKKKNDKTFLKKIFRKN